MQGGKQQPQRTWRTSFISAKSRQVETTLFVSLRGPKLDKASYQDKTELRLRSDHIANNGLQSEDA